MHYYSPFWGPRAISTIDDPWGAFMCRSSTLAVLADSGPFRGLLLSFGVPEWFPWLTNTRVHLCVGQQHSQFGPILARFMDYYSLIWGPRAISMIDDPRGTLTYRSSIIQGLSDSWLLHGLLLTVLGSQSDFHGCWTLRCAYMSVINNCSLGRFWPVSWTITLFWGPRVISTIGECRGAFMCRSSTLAVLADFGLFHGILIQSHVLTRNYVVVVI